MDQTALVVNPTTLPLEQRDGGEKLIRRARDDGMAVDGALWTAAPGDGQPYLYLITPEVADRDPRPAYGKVAAAQVALERAGLPWAERIDDSGVKLIPPTHPLAQGLQSRFGRLAPDNVLATWYYKKPLGSVPIDGAYIYPASLFRPQPAAEPAAAAPPAGV